MSKFYHSFFGSIVLVLLTVALLSSCEKQSGSQAANPDVDYYTCTMHPSVHSHDPKAKCPICSMDLEPVLKKGATHTTNAHAAESVSSPEFHDFSVPVERQQQIGVIYAEAKTLPLHRIIRAAGTVATDMTRHWEFVARVEGYVQSLDVTSPGESVKKDQALLSIYSPDLMVTERELVNQFNARDHETTAEGKARNASLIEASRRRLEQWNITPQQITELEKTRKTPQFLTFRSPFDGVIEEVPVHQGRKVMPGDHLVDVVDLSLVWVWAEFYENELASLAKGQKVIVTSSSYPGEKFSGEIALVSPFVADMKRTSRVRLDIPNPDFKLRPGMFVTAELTVEHGQGLAIPLSAVMPTGERTLVFVDKSGGKLEPRAVQLGGQYGDFHEVLGGLKEGERVVASANFLIDAESKVQGAVKSFEPPDAAIPLPQNAILVFEPMLQSYFALKNALAQDQDSAIAPAATKLRERVEDIAKSETQPRKDAARYRERIGALSDALSQFKAGSLEEARVHFGKVSAALIALLTEFPPPLPKPVYVMNCGMWEKSPGNWMQATQDVENPFMGKKMLDCGDLVKTLTTAK